MSLFHVQAHPDIQPPQELEIHSLEEGYPVIHHLQHSIAKK